MSTKQSKFDLWWNSFKVRRVVGALYSIGASVVILGAMGKILHTPWGGWMLGIGMSVEAFLFFIGVFDKPYEQFDWAKVFKFDESSNLNLMANQTSSQPAAQSVQPTAQSVHEPTGQSVQPTAQSFQQAAPHSTHQTVSQNTSALASVELINEKDIQKLSEGIRNLTATTEQLSSLTTVLGPTDKLVKNLNAASEVTSIFISTQAELNNSSASLNSSYHGVNESMSAVGSNTKSYAQKVDEINKSLSSIHSLYEIQINSVQSQSEGISKQKELVGIATSEYQAILEEVQKIKSATLATTHSVQDFKTGSEKLNTQVSELNQIYGNMLNALN